MDKVTFRRFFTRKVAGASRRRQIHRSAPRSLNHAFFPITFFVRNVMTLTTEAAWNRASPRLQRMKIRNLLEERSKFFFEVVRWLDQHGEAKIDARTEEGCRAYKGKGDPPSVDSYCTHCGGCCEIASGLPDFPSESIIPARWQRMFGEGLGRGHRFCPFLREERLSGGSLCAIHSWRSHPCRVFEAEECQFLLNDPEFQKLSDTAALNRIYHLLLRLVDAR